jgi:murein DD-endopeptidase MepM/ murein hydrolase activator NlpD
MLAGLALAITTMVLQPGQAGAAASAAGTAAASAAAPPPAAGRLAVAGEWSWPLDVPRQVLRAFAAPVQPWSAGHRGVDLTAGADLLAPADGVIRFAGWVVDRPVLSIDHGSIISSYEPVAALVGEGAVVHEGQVIARIEPGHCAESCVHMGMRIDGLDDAYRNPLLWLGGVPRSVLLPTRTPATRADAPAGSPP